MLVEAGRTMWNRWSTRLVLRRSAAIVGDCRPVRAAVRRFGMPDDRIITFPWGIDLTQFVAQPYPPGGRFTLLSTRSWEPIYGVDIIAHAFVQAARQQPELQLIMLGNGSLAGQLSKIFQQGGVMDQVFLPGQVSQSELPRLYAMADLYLAAAHSDGTSISLLEAMASARPVLVSDIPGNREWVSPGEQGWLFPDGDINALAALILQAFSERERLIEMSRRARQTAEERANWEDNFPLLLQAYDLARKTAECSQRQLSR
jgi:glycosyltransferase involved in cell wall biosynthesis